MSLDAPHSNGGRDTIIWQRIRLRRGGGVLGCQAYLRRVIIEAELLCTYMNI